MPCGWIWNDTLRKWIWRCWDAQPAPGFTELVLLGVLAFAVILVVFRFHLKLKRSNLIESKRVKS